MLLFYNKYPFISTPRFILHAEAMSWVKPQKDPGLRSDLLKPSLSHAAEQKPALPVDLDCTRVTRVNAGLRKEYSNNLT